MEHGYFVFSVGALKQKQNAKYGKCVVHPKNIQPNRMCSLFLSFQAPANFLMTISIACIIVSPFHLQVLALQMPIPDFVKWACDRSTLLGRSPRQFVVEGEVSLDFNFSHGAISFVYDKDWGGGEGVNCLLMNGA